MPFAFAPRHSSGDRLGRDASTSKQFSDFFTVTNVYAKHNGATIMHVLLVSFDNQFVAWWYEYSFFDVLAIVLNLVETNTAQVNICLDTYTPDRC